MAERALTYALNVISEDGSEERRAQMTSRLDALDRECRNLSTAIARGGDLDTLLVELQAREQERVSIRKRLAVLEAEAHTVSRAALRKQLSAYLADMKALLTGADVSQAQSVLKKLINGRLTFNPQSDGSYAFRGTGTVEPVLAGLVSLRDDAGAGPLAGWRGGVANKNGVPSPRPGSRIYRNGVPTQDTGAVATNEAAGGNSNMYRRLRVRLPLAASQTPSSLARMISVDRSSGNEMSQSVTVACHLRPNPTDSSVLFPRPMKTVC